MPVFEKKIVLAQIVKHIRSLGVDEDTAADCLQEAKVAIWQAEQDGKIHADSFFVGIGISAITDYLSGWEEGKGGNQRYGGPLIRTPRSAYIPPPSEENNEAGESQWPKLDLPLSDDGEIEFQSGENVEQIVLNKIEREERRAKIRAGFAGLSEGERRVVEIFMERPTLLSKEAAIILKISQDTLELLRRRAIVKLRAFINGDH